MILENEIKRVKLLMKYQLGDTLEEQVLSNKSMLPLIDVKVEDCDENGGNVTIMGTNIGDKKIPFSIETTDDKNLTYIIANGELTSSKQSETFSGLMKSKYTLTYFIDSMEEVTDFEIKCVSKPPIINAKATCDINGGKITVTSTNIGRDQIKIALYQITGSKHYEKDEAELDMKNPTFVFDKLPKGKYKLLYKGITVSGEYEPELEIICGYRS